MFVAGGLSELIAEYFRRRLPLLLGVVSLFLVGIVFGALAVQTLSGPQREDLSTYLQNFYTTLPQELAVVNRQQIARQGMADNILKTTGLMWLLGLTVIGAPFILGVIFLRGFVIGFTVGFIVEELIYRGVALAIASIFPHHILSVPAIILAGVATISFSTAAGKTLLGVSEDSIYNHFLTCSLLTLISAGLLGLAAFVEAYITPVFIRLTQGLVF